MGRIQTKLVAVAQESELRSFVPLSTEQMVDYQHLLSVFGGLEPFAAEVRKELCSELDPSVDQAIQEALPIWASCPEVESLLTTASRPALGAYGDRFAGMRTVWNALDPEVARFKTELQKNQVPPPCELIIEQLRSVGQVKRIGDIVILDGVPVPAGPEQVASFVTLRWRWLVIPPGMLSAKSEVKIADASLKLLFGYSTKDHIENLVNLQGQHLKLFHAVWIRDLQAVEDITNMIERKELTTWLAAPDRRFRRMKDPVDRLLHCTAIMSELERCRCRMYSPQKCRTKIPQFEVSANSLRG